jgi:hypothetical protein
MLEFLFSFLADIIMQTLIAFFFKPIFELLKLPVSDRFFNKLANILAIFLIILIGYLFFLLLKTWI